MVYKTGIWGTQEQHRSEQRKKYFREYQRRYKKLHRSVKSGEGKYQLLCANCNFIKRYTNKEIKLI